MHLNDRIYANPIYTLHEQNDDWAVLFDADTYKSITLNPVGVFIWKQLNGIDSVHDIIRKLQDNYEGFHGSEEQYVMEFIEQLVVEGCAGYQDGK